MISKNNSQFARLLQNPKTGLSQMSPRPSREKRETGSEKQETRNEKPETGNEKRETGQPTDPKSLDISQLREHPNPQKNVDSRSSDRQKELEE